MNFHFNTLDSCQGKRTCFVLLAGSFIPAWKQWSSQELWRAVRKRALRVLASRECGIPMCLSINQTEPVQYHVDTSSAHQSSAFWGGYEAPQCSPGAQCKLHLSHATPCDIIKLLSLVNSTSTHKLTEKVSVHQIKSVLSVRAAWDLTLSSHLLLLFLVCLFLHLSTFWGAGRSHL